MTLLNTSHRFNHTRHQVWPRAAVGGGAFWNYNSSWSFSEVEARYRRDAHSSFFAHTIPLLRLPLTPFFCTLLSCTVNSALGTLV